MWNSCSSRKSGPPHLTLNSLENTINLLRPLIKEMDRLNQELGDSNKIEVIIHLFLQQLKKGKALVSKCSSIRRWKEEEIRKKASEYGFFSSWAFRCASGWTNAWYPTPLTYTKRDVRLNKGARRICFSCAEQMCCHSPAIGLCEHWNYNNTIRC